MDALSTSFGLFLKGGAALLVFNEVRGLVLAAPVFYGMYQSGGSLMAIWLGICSLGGIALSVVVPMVAAARLLKVLRRTHVPNRQLTISRNPGLSLGQETVS